MKKFPAALFVALAWCCSAAQAQNLVQNPGFESGAASWTTTFNWFLGVNGFQHSGTSSAFTACVGSACITTDPLGFSWLYQDIPTTPGTTYVVRFWYATRTPADNPVELQVFFGAVPPSSNAPGTCTGSCIFDTQAPTSGFVQVTKQVVATAATMRLEFLGRNDPLGMYVDDVSVTPITPVPALSERGLLMLAVFLVAGASLELVRRRPRSQ